MVTEVETDGEVPAKQRKARLPKSVRHALVSAGVLLTLIVLAGVVYTFFLGPSTPQNAAASLPVEAPAEPVIKPTAPAANAKESAAVEALTTPVTPGTNASITVKTNAASTCAISVVYNNVPSTDSGLTPKTADDYGTVTWTWTVGPNVPLGKWPVKVTCAYHTRTAVVQGDLVVAKTLDQN